MRKVYLLEHGYVDDFGCDDTKILGIFSSQQEAESAIETYLELPGFRDRKDGFRIDTYELNKKHWVDGFVSSFDNVDECNETDNAVHFDKTAFIEMNKRNGFERAERLLDDFLGIEIDSWNYRSVIDLLYNVNVRSFYYEGNQYDMEKQKDNPTLITIHDEVFMEHGVEAKLATFQINVEDLVELTRLEGKGEYTYKKEYFCDTIIKDNQIYYPCDVAFGFLDVKASYDDMNQTVTAKEGDITLSFTIGEAQYSKNGVIHPMDAQVFIQYDKIWVPILVVAQALGATVEWDIENKIGMITKQW